MVLKASSGVIPLIPAGSPAGPDNNEIVGCKRSPVQPVPLFEIRELLRWGVDKEHISVTFFGKFDRFTGTLRRDLEIHIVLRFVLCLKIIQEPGIVQARCCSNNELLPWS